MYPKVGSTRYGHHMSTDPRAALAAFVAALERHLEASASPHREDDPVVLSAYQQIAATFETYEEALSQAYGEVTPLEVYDSDDDLDDDEDLDDLDDYDLDDDEDVDDDDLDGQSSSSRGPSPR